VKLLFDENLSPGLVSRLADLFPNSAHVHECGLGESSDTAIWAFAAREDFTIVSKDWDFHDQALFTDQQT
jgi:predicted nuclease of predicted toxin-antitoxin system